MKYLFAHMCNLLSNDGKRVDKNIIWFDAILMLSLGTLAWVVTVIASIHFFIFDENFPIKGSRILWVAIPSFSFYFLFVKNKQYLKIFQTYENETVRENRRGKIISVLFVFVPIIVTMLMSLIWHDKI